MFRKNLTVFAIILGLCCAVSAEWPSDPSVNVPICTDPAPQATYPVAITTDGAGGAIVVWDDSRGSSTDIYAQWVDLEGVVRWTLDGVVVCDEGSSQSHAVAVSDGAGGAIVVWRDRRAGDNYDIYAQRIDSAGALGWPVGAPSSDGIAICDLTGDQELPIAVSDGAGGAIITWEDERDPGWVIFAQRVNSDGELQWPTGAPSTAGAEVCTASGIQWDISMVGDGAGGALLAWEDGRNNAETNFDIYAQRIDPDGASLWAVGGIAASRADLGETDPVIAGDGAGGAIVAWVDRRDLGTTKFDIRARLINSVGGPDWPANEVVVCNHEYDQDMPEIVSDGEAGAIIAWRDIRGQTSTLYDVYAQRVDAAAAALWIPNGVAVVAAEDQQQSHKMLSDGAHGAIITWSDQRNDSADVYAQLVTAAGEVGAPDGVAVSNAVSIQSISALTSDGLGGAIIAWRDWRTSATSSTDVYAQRVVNNTPIFSDGFESSDTGAWSGAVP
ncbi:MAG: hypothetical protein K8R59_13915 [Thermoanaerobaculales bacterium]|nr:hypothetical protein [Thermoanaerobaculales bacterium]